MSQDRVNGNFVFAVDRFEGVGTDYEGLFSGTKITKERLLSTKNTPCDYLLSYAKMFGLYFYYDSTEVADDPEKYPSGVVHIMDRDTFYTDEVVDLSKMIDWDKKIEITPPSLIQSGINSIQSMLRVNWKPVINSNLDRITGHSL